MAEPPGEGGVSELNPLAEVRQARMAGIIWDEGFARVTDLAGRFGVSAFTVRADLTALEARARVRRVRGRSQIRLEIEQVEPRRRDRASVRQLESDLELVL